MDQVSAALESDLAMAVIGLVLFAIVLMSIPQ